MSKHIKIVGAILIFVLSLINSLTANEFGGKCKLYECEYFKIGDKITYSFYWIYFNKTDFVGIVIKIEPKPTNEYMHLITIKRLYGSGTSGIYSEQFLKKYDHN